ncbi:substrate-binding domain-containing protein [Cohnella hongkongensis]|uniref:Substrate-binding domain-containing protein n=1 Tax=Cohnella hongkongensis TaxID=178337 RepID=A0ABV9FH53_9BACL
MKESIRTDILEGKIIPNQKIGSETDLIKRFNVSRQTIRQAVGELENEGWLYREQGRGTFCADRTKTMKDNQSHKTIAIITSYIRDGIFPSIIRGAESYLSEKGYSILLASTNHNMEQEKKCLQNILTRRVDGLIVEPTKSAITNPNIGYYLNIENSGIPYVMINAFYPELSPLSLTMDDELGGFKATEHLIQLGHKRIAGIFKTDELQGGGRMKGFIRAHREAKLEMSPNMVITYVTKEQYANPKEEIMRLLLQEEALRPTAIFCYNDEVAFHVYAEIRKLGLRVPEDISLVGFDDSHFAQMNEVKFTTIKHPKAMMGEDAAKMIIELTKGGRDVQSMVYAPELIVRNSTAPYPV